ncbi:plasmid partitioning protein ParA [Synechococcus sp. KORDI-100]|uniref:ParA family protein n=1 Tax=Synechococcus sp. KORDI-100 TaxID=1280380 RepID=UPI0004E06B17|nr:ParA family protein [Synechococcus sp. KORDI-100]AII43811.1 plasmid partitioning protein ParA [Synechococcus sp. KORDI-100]
MFLTVFGQKGGVAKTCTSVHLACVWAQQGHSVCVVDADRNRSATAYAARGMLPFEVVPVEAAAKATRAAQVIITDGQASSHEEELKNLSAGADLVLLPTTPQARSVELTIELSSILRSMDTLHAALLVKVDSRKQRLANDARQTLDGFGVDVLTAEIPLLAAFEKAEVEGVCVSEAVDDRGRADLRRMGGWSAYCAAAVQIRERLMAADATDSMIA